MTKSFGQLNTPSFSKNISNCFYEITASCRFSIDLKLLKSLVEENSILCLYSAVECMYCTVQHYE